MGGELDRLVPPLRRPVHARDQPHAVDPAEVAVDERVARLRLVRRALREAEVPVGVLLPRVRLEEGVLVGRLGLHRAPVALEHVLPRLDPLARAGYRSLVHRVGRHGPHSPVPRMKRVSEQPDTPVERIVRRSLIDEEGLGKPFSERVRHHKRTLENYLKAGSVPRWMERVTEVDQGIARERRRFAERYRALKGEYGHDREEFARRWEAIAAAARFDDLNELIRQHNDWYPIERDLPMDMRTRDYVLINGRSYRREPLSAEWVLGPFPGG